MIYPVEVTKTNGVKAYTQGEGIPINAINFRRSASTDSNGQAITLAGVFVTSSPVTIGQRFLYENERYKIETIDQGLTPYKRIGFSQDNG